MQWLAVYTTPHTHTPYTSLLLESGVAGRCMTMWQVHLQRLFLLQEYAQMVVVPQVDICQQLLQERVCAAE